MQISCHSCNSSGGSTDTEALVVASPMTVPPPTRVATHIRLAGTDSDATAVGAASAAVGARAEGGAEVKL